MKGKLQMFKEWVEASDNIVFFGGAGVSTESGIPDFRSVDGLYNQKYDYPPETILNRNFFLQLPAEFYRFFNEKLICENAKPSTTHKVLARLEEEGKLKAVITQNIDGLHQMAGSKNVIELHGTIHRSHCVKCEKIYGLDAMKVKEGIPRCSCGGVIKPDIVLYGEDLNQEDLRKAVRLVEEADMLIVGGTSLGVYPAAGLINYYKGKKLVLINKTATPFDSRADLLIHDGLGKVFGVL